MNKRTSHTFFSSLTQRIAGVSCVVRCHLIANVLRNSDEISIKMSIMIIVIFAFYGIIIYQEI